MVSAFFIVLKGEDFADRSEIADRMSYAMLDIDKFEQDTIKRISIAFAYAEYNSRIDKSIDDTIKRADNMLYENKGKYKELLGMW